MDTFQTIGAVLAFFLLLIQVFDRIPLLRRYFIIFSHWLKKAKKMFREWWWWNQYCPFCEIVDLGVLKIEESKSGYYMELPICVKYVSRDNRHDTKMDTTSIYLDVISTGKGRDSKPYRLASNDWLLKISPREEEAVSEGSYPVMNLIWMLPRSSTVIIKYTFFAQVNALPLVNESATCKIVSIGKAEIEGITGSKSLKAPNKFSVKVILSETS